MSRYARVNISRDSPILPPGLHSSSPDPKIVPVDHSKRYCRRNDRAGHSESAFTPHRTISEQKRRASRDCELLAQIGEANLRPSSERRKGDCRDEDSGRIEEEGEVGGGGRKEITSCKIAAVTFRSRNSRGQVNEFLPLPFHRR